jgi:signal transduction histidine kinase
MPTGSGRCWAIWCKTPFKYSPNGGLVEVSDRRIEEAVEISVRDEGIGVPRDEVGLIFQSFYWGSGEARGTSGTGLGLYISQPIVEAHGGRIWATSTPGDGSRFLFTLPLAREPVPLG